MKKISVIVLMSLGVAFAGYTQAANGKKSTRSASRIGPYAGGFAGYTTFSADGAEAVEIALENTLSTAGDTVENLSSSTEDTDIGYQLMFGYRFHRFFAVELGLAQFGALSSKARADIDFGDGDGAVPTTVEVSYSPGGPIFSAIGILPLGEKFELFGRLGYLFNSGKLEFNARINGNPAGSNNLNGDSQDPVYGLGFAWHINKVYSIRGEYQQLNDIGQASSTGKQDFKVIGLGVIVRF